MKCGIFRRVAAKRRNMLRGDAEHRNAKQRNASDVNEPEDGAVFMLMAAVGYPSTC